MSAKDDGGPAFANPVTPDPSDGSYLSRPQVGMSLRDWYAGMALQGFLASGIAMRLHDLGMNKTVIPDNCAAIAFEWADAMLAARKELPL